MHKLKDLKIWSRALELCIDIYKATQDFPKQETYGLTSQMRRAAVSISSNISEGAGRHTNGQFIQFLSFATGSAYELQTQLHISNRLNLIHDEEMCRLENNINELLKMIYVFKQNMITKPAR